MPYEWVCESCGLRLYSAAPGTGQGRCPRCDAPLPEPRDYSSPKRSADKGKPSERN